MAINISAQFRFEDSKSVYWHQGIFEEIIILGVECFLPVCFLVQLWKLSFSTSQSRVYQLKL